MLHKYKRIVRNWLEENRIAYSKLSGETVSFSDLARDSAVFIKIHGWTPSPKAKEIKEIAHAAGFCVEFTC